MKSELQVINEIEKLLSEYEKEVLQAYDKGYLQKNTVKTYLLHANNFVRWCKDDFEPGNRNK